MHLSGAPACSVAFQTCRRLHPFPEMTISSPCAPLLCTCSPHCLVIQRGAPVLGPFLRLSGGASHAAATEPAAAGAMPVVETAAGVPPPPGVVTAASAGIPSGPVLAFFAPTSSGCTSARYTIHRYGAASLKNVCNKFTKRMTAAATSQYAFLFLGIVVPQA